jgi:hypothetical protein
VARIPIGDRSRIEHDPDSGAIRSWFDAALPAADKTQFDPRDVARAVLSESADLFKWPVELHDLAEGPVIDGVDAHSVRWTQHVSGVPVDTSEVVVNLFADGTLHSIYNGYHYDVPQGIARKPIKVKEGQAREIAARSFHGIEGFEIRAAALIIYRYRRDENRPPKRDRTRERLLDSLQPAGEEGKHYLVWDVRVVTSAPAGDWRLLIDARDGSVVDLVDLAQYATGSGKVYDPNPVVTGGNAALGAGAPAATLEAQTTLVALPRLNAADAAGNLHLDGTHVQMQDFDGPTFAEPVNAAGNFSFSVTTREFLSVMAYFHIDRFQDYIQNRLGLSNVANFSIPVDAQGVNGADNSYFSPSSNRIAFGEGGVPDASDAMVILHEYGHAIQFNSLPGFDNPAAGTGEGFGDFLAAVYYDLMHSNPAATRGWMMSWDAQTGWPGRRYDRPHNFDDAAYTAAGMYARAELWASVMFELYRKLGGDSQWYPQVREAARDLAIRLHLMANFNVPASGSTAAQMGQQVEAADGALNGWNGLANGLHRKVIYDTFARRHLTGYTAQPVDVYVNDGREGGYGSASGLDQFNEVLWQDNYWMTQDIWVRTTPYASAADQQAGGPGDHVEPPVGSTAYLYTRVKNRGTNAAGSGAVTVRAFTAGPGIGLTWPDDWTEMDDTDALPVTNVLPGAGNGVVAGPFKWSPTDVGHECVLVVLENSADRAVTQDLAPTDHVGHNNLVPFDNNIAQRNLVPTAAKGKMSRGFWLRNPDEVVREIRLDVTSTLPDGWTWSLGRINAESIRLAPLQRTWIDLVIDQAGGPEVKEFDTRYELTVTGSIEGRLIGGMTYYVAPDSAFHRPPHEQPGSRLEPCETKLCLDVPWRDFDYEGELELRLRFRSKP